MSSKEIGIDLGNLGDGLLRALLEDDPSKRRDLAVAWKDSVWNLAQERLPETLSIYLSIYVQAALDDWGRINDSYRREVLRNDLAKHVTDGLAVVVKLGTVVKALPQNSNPQPTSGDPQVSGEDGGSYGATRRSPNDDRSDSMNPNNPASQAAEDNHANQLNPNNPAYRSSR
jgi:hypothetical protein